MLEKTRFSPASLNRRSGWTNRAVLAVLGLMMASGHAPLGLWPLTAFGLGLWAMIFAAEASSRKAMHDAWWIGFGYFLGVLHWIVMPFLVDVGRDGWMAPFALVLLPAGLAVFWGGAMWLAKRFVPSAPFLGWASALAWTELARGHLFTGFPWGGISHVFVDTYAAPLFAVLGAEGLTIVTLIWVAYATFLLARQSRFFLLSLAPFAVLVFPYDPAPVTAPSDAPFVRMIQPNAPQHEKWDPQKAQIFLDRHLSYTAAPSERPLDLIIWPETAVPYALEYAQPTLTEISNRASGTPVALGINRINGQRFYNALAVIGREGQVQTLYDKTHLVPFGEYVPFGEVLGRLGIYGLAASQGGGYSSGTDTGPIDLGAIGTAKVLICYEGIFPWEVRSGPRPDVLMLVTNDAWFGNWAGPLQHLAQARIRAIELGLPMVRVANTGVSALIDPKGTIVQSLPLNTQGALDVSLPKGGPPTLFARFSSWPAILLLAISTCGAIWSLTTKSIDRSKRRV